MNKLPVLKQSSYDKGFKFCLTYLFYKSLNLALSSWKSFCAMQRSPNWMLKMVHPANKKHHWYGTHFAQTKSYLYLNYSSETISTGSGDPKGGVDWFKVYLLDCSTRLTQLSNLYIEVLRVNFFVSFSAVSDPNP